jgi:PHD/YefM family antitoxin component YafN of YafNO toxin-antitoxin module
VTKAEGFQRFRQYNLSRVPVVVINHEYIILSDEMTYEKLSTVIEAYLRETTANLETL